MHRSIAVALAVLSVYATAEAAEDSKLLADKYVELLRFEDQYVNYREQCISTHRTVAPEALVAKNPNYFGGIQPGQKKWQGIAAAYEAYFQEACSRPTKGEFLAAISKSYSSSLTSKQLKTAIDFYSSSTGQALVTAHTKATAAVYDTWTQVNGRHLTEISARFQSEISRLVQAK